MQQFSEISSIFIFDNITNEANLRDFLIFLNYQHQKRNNSARHPWKMENWMQSWRPHTNIFCNFSPPKKFRSYEILPLSCKMTSSNLKIWCSKIPPLSGNQCPDLLNSSDEYISWYLLYCACHGKYIFNNPLQISRACHRFWKCYKFLTFCSILTKSTIPCACHAKRYLNVQKRSEPLVFFSFWFRNMFRAITTCTFSTSQFPKAVRTWGIFSSSTCKCVSHHNGVYFFDVVTSKKGPNMARFMYFFASNWASRHNGVHFFDILISKSGPNMRYSIFLPFSLRNLHCITTACNFSSLI